MFYKKLNLAMPIYDMITGTFFLFPTYTNLQIITKIDKGIIQQLLISNYPTANDYML